MSPFDFKKYHLRAINAKSEEEKAIINDELKELYESLDEETKRDFNAQLEIFLLGEYKKINTLYNGIKN